MEDNKRIFKFYGKPGEDYQLWAARTQAALYAKEVGDVIENDFLAEEAVDEETKKRISTACAIIIQGLGDKPLRLCLAERTDPFKMWKRLCDRYAVSNTATRVQLQSKLSKLSYTGQVMGDYVDSFEDIFNRLAGMDSSISEELQVAMFLSSFGDLTRSKFGHAISSLQNVQETLSWETATARLLQAYEDAMWHAQGHKGGSATSMSEESQALIAAKSWKRKPWNSYRKGSRPEKRRCYACHEVGHLAKNCPKKNVGNEKRSTARSNSLFGDSSYGTSIASTATLLLAKTESDERHDCKASSETYLNETVEHSEDQGAHDAKVSSECKCWGTERHSAHPCNTTGSIAAVDSRILLDSGASDHMVPNVEWLTNVRKIPIRVIALGDGNKVTSNWSGTLEICVALRGNGETLYRNMVLHDVLLVPALNSSLLSIAKLCDGGYEMNFGRKRCVALRDGYIEFYGIKTDGIYQLDGAATQKTTSYANAAVASKSALETWHARLGHANMQIVRELAASGAVIGLELQKPIQKKEFCSSCIKGKQFRSVLRTNRSRSKEKGAVIHTDVCGPMSCESFSGCRYFVSFIDEYSGYITIVPIKLKSDVKKEFQRYHAWIERRFGCTVKRLHSDNGGEFVALRDYLIAQGIEQTMAPPYSPNMNAIAERANRTIVESARSMLEHAHLPRTFWAEAVVHASRIRNIFFCPRDHTVTSYELMHGTKPNVSYLRTFGCLAWNHLPKDVRKKLDAKSEPGVVIGCFENSQYKLWIPNRECAVISRDVRISEDVLPGTNLSQWISEDSLVSRNDVRTRDTVTPLPRGARTQMTQQETRGQNDVTVGPGIQDPPARENMENDEVRHDLTGEEQEMLTHYPESSDPPVEESDIDNQEPLQNTEREHDINRRYPSRQRSQTQFYSPGSAHVASVYAYDAEPVTVAEAMAMEDAQLWKDAIASELRSLDKHKVWYPTSLPEGKKSLPTRFVFQRKYDSSGKLVRHKARLVVQGYLQGVVEYTYAPVVDFTTVRTCLAIAVQKDYFIHQMDVRTAFLHGRIDEEIYVTPPKGFEVRKGSVMKLSKGLYGLKQSPRLWNQKWREVMTSLKFSMLSADSCFFMRRDVWLLLYVDDILIMAPKLSSIQELKHEISTHLDVKDMGELRSFLGISFTAVRNGAWLSQIGYTEHILKWFGMDQCKPVCTPMVDYTSPMEDSESTRKAISSLNYQEIVGCLLFLATRTRPDISSAVGILCRYASTPTYENTMQLKRVLRYLRGTSHYGLWLDSTEGELSAFCDADWAGSRVDRKSTSGILIKLGNTTVAWKTLKQNCIALSTTEAEFISLSEATKEIIWLRKLLEEIDERKMDATTLYVDNQGALSWGVEGVRNAKHVSIRVNFVKQEVENGSLQLRYCPSIRMPADILTKPLSRVLFEKHRANLGVLNMDTARGGVGNDAVTMQDPGASVHVVS